MNKTVKKAWVEALRSGEYKQGTGALRDQDDGFCCLGVLCDLAVKAGVAEEESKQFGFYYGKGEEWAGGSLPEVVQKWAGLNRFPSVSDITPDARTVGLEILNDIRHWDFNRIADAIEADL